jgi:uncharacterized membrane protein (GlpM family)
MTATTDRQEPRAGVKPSALKDLSFSELAIRFTMGALASLAAGLVAQAFGTRIGGIPLALPAIFVASITLEQRQDSRDAMQHQVTGAPLGALGMIAFALTVVALVERLPLAAVLALATLAWVAVSLAAYGIVQVVCRPRSDT